VRPTGNSALQDLFERPGTAELVADGVTISPTALHYGANDWSRALRRAGITRGDRVLCALPNGPAFLQLLIAALADGLTLVPVHPHEDVVALLPIVDARIAVALEGTHASVAIPSRAGGPPGSAIVPRTASQRTDGVAFLLRTSGTSAAPRWVAIGERGILAVLESHLPVLALDGASTLCVLPWSHAFGLILGVLPALLRSRRVVTTTTAPSTVDALLALCAASNVNHCSMVPLIAQRLATTPEGTQALLRLTGGLIGGAPINDGLVPVLSRSALRVGYGQTEASPGIMVGNPGEFSVGFLGRPLGCEVRIDADDVLAFRGANASDGVWMEGTLHRNAPDSWHRTGDLVAMRDGAFHFLGRLSGNFKLANGRMVEAARIEALLRQRIARLTDVVVADTSGDGMQICYSTSDALPVAEKEFRLILGAMAPYLTRCTCVGVDAWARTPKGEIDRRIILRP
jgi:acyl-CoA synthetase (AMP-forming)/AMP-acid ligase II